jgi:hypothetical protein
MLGAKVMLSFGKRKVIVVFGVCVGAIAGDKGTMPSGNGLKPG